MGGQSLFLKGTGCPGDGEGQQNDITSADPDKNSHAGLFLMELFKRVIRGSLSLSFG